MLDAIAALQPLLRSDPASGTRIVLQAERARAEGVDVASVLVADDIALSDAKQLRSNDRR
ncbi:MULTISPECIES: hypothetical protein [Xanthomonas translucens group]|uniref:Uncharacterized protein n=1 Tax=Xanthomonas cerealis pv. cerealis TaxID=152263 RepID=A0A514EFY0_9XANT|nr:hypothetical protein [Xanthomonas translucens]QDI04940.1 hypothetical protein E4A48_15720 [Xanthomonas translucens pv. cerealis]UKE46951.1 hypothetical protein KHA79_18185 [Xanthomonas translucens pv. cerealis]